MPIITETSGSKAVYSEILPMGPLGFTYPDSTPIALVRKSSRKMSSGGHRRARRAAVTAFRDATRVLVTWMQAVLPGVDLTTSAMKMPTERSEKQRLKEREEALAAVVQAAKYFVIVLDSKGGLGKSLMAQVCFEALSAKGRNVLILDADKGNSNISRAGLAKKEDALRADRADFVGFLLDAAEQLEEGIVQAVVVDSAATGEEYFNKHLVDLAAQIKGFGGRLIIIRPITTNPINQDNCIWFARNVMSPDMGVVMVRNHGQGRTDEDFRIWMESPEHKEMIELGMVEIDLETAGALYSDIATEIGISIADIARKKPEQMDLSGRKLELARKYLTRPVALFIAKWMLRQTTAFLTAFASAIDRTVP